MGANQFIPLPLPNPAFQPFIDPNLKPIIAVTNANPAAVTTGVPHGFVNGDVVVIKGVLGMGAGLGTTPNTTAAILVTGLSTFTLVGVDTSLVGPYAGGGQVAKSGKRLIVTITPGTPIKILTNLDHKLITGDAVKITGETNFPNANGVWTITVTSLTEFTLDGTSDIGQPVPGTGIVDLGPFPVVCQTPTPHGYNTGSVVDVRSSGSDPGQLFEITFISPTQFSLDLDGEDIQYPQGGIVRQVSTGALDLALIVPPNGIEKRKTFSVAGDYSGRIIVEGSMNGDKFSPFLLFNEGKPGGIKVVEVNVPFIRTRGENLVINSGILVGFLAAEENCDCQPAWSDHGANVYDNLDVPDPSELPLDREDPVPVDDLASPDAFTPIIVTTATDHPYVTGDLVKLSNIQNVSGIPSPPNLNTTFTITFVSTTSFTLDGTNGGAFGPYAGIGGQVALVTAPNTSPIPLTTAVPHGYFTGDTVRVRGVVDDETLFSITSIFSPDNVTPVTITTGAAHGYTTGNRVQITGSAIPDGIYTITVTGGFTFTLNGVVGPVNGSGGTSLRLPGADGDFVITVTGPDTFTLDGSLATGNGTGGTVQALTSGGTTTSNMKSEKTLQLQGGPYTGTFIVEGTLDPGISPIFLPFSRQFNTGGADEKLELDALFAKMRIAPEGASGDVSIFIGSQLACDCLPPIPGPPPGAEPAPAAPGVHNRGREATASDRASSGSIHNRAAAKLAKRKPSARKPKKNGRK
jgi:hypothetical protein